MSFDGHVESCAVEPSCEAPVPKGKGAPSKPVDSAWLLVAEGGEESKTEIRCFTFSLLFNGLIYNCFALFVAFFALAFA